MSIRGRCGVAALNEALRAAKWVDAATHLQNGVPPLHLPLAKWPAATVSSHGKSKALKHLQPMLSTFGRVELLRELLSIGSLGVEAPA